jgi:hypothetical protein
VSAEDKEPFLSRWSRRKLYAEKEEAAPKPDVSVASSQPGIAAPAAAPSAPRPELPPVDSLQGLASEYKDFLHPQVDEKLRQAALKKLFHDPHFNVMDGLDTYIDDYSKPDPIPDEMLKALKQANRLLFPEEAAAKEQGDSPDSGKTAVAGDTTPAADAQSSQAGGGSGTPASEPPAPQDSKPPAKPA